MPALGLTHVLFHTVRKGRQIKLYYRAELSQHDLDALGIFNPVELAKGLIPILNGSVDDAPLTAAQAGSKELFQSPE